MNVTPTGKTVTLEDGSSHQSTYAYDESLTIGGQNISFGDLTSQYDYDYGGALLKKTVNAYLYTANSSYLPLNMLDRVSSTTVYNGSSQEVAQTKYGYDEGASTLTGSLTSVQRWLNTTGTFLTTHYAYNSNGTRSQMTDPLGNETNFSYSSTYNGAYPTTIQEPVVNGVAHNTSYTYDFNMGFKASATDYSGQPTNYLYDNVGRASQISYPDGGQVTFSYSSPSSPPTITQTELLSSSPSQSISETILFDSLNRPYQTQLTSDPEGADYVDTTHDALGRVASVSNPYRSTSDATYGITSNSYDALGRTTVVTRSDGSDVESGYSGRCTSITDEAGNPSKSCSDALGRLIEVDEPGTDAQIDAAGSATITINGGDQSNTLPGTKSSGTFSISGSSPSSGCGSTTIVLDANGTAIASTAYAPGSTPSSVASALTNAMSNSSIITAAVSGSTISVTSKGTGSSTNYNLSGTPSTVSPPCRTITVSASGMSGGTDGQTIYDTGSVSITANGVQSTVNYGQADTPSTLAAALSSAINSNSSSGVTTSANGNTININATDTGSSSNYPLSTSVSWNTGHFANPSFTVSAPSALTGGTDGSVGSSPLVTLYSYDALNDLTCVVQKGTDTTAFSSCAAAPATWRPRSFVYDSLSRLTKATNPESGTITYHYDANGNISSKVAPKPSTTAGSLTTNYSYDPLNRLTQRSYVTSSTTPAAQYGYDGVPLSGCATTAPPISSPTNLIGQRSEMCAGPSHSLLSYDAMGRASQEARRQMAGANGYNMTIRYTYYKDGSINTVTYPSGDIVTYTIQPAGRISQVSDSNTNFVTPPSGTMYAPSGLLSSMTQGSSITTNNSYNKRMQPSVLSAGTTSTPIVNLGYNFHLGSGDNGNIFQITDNVDSTRSTAFQYDLLNRISQANTVTTTGPNCWGEVYSIDSWSNLTNISGVSSMTGCFSESLNAAPATTKNQLTGLSYDIAGDVTNDGNGNTPTYDGEARIVTAASVSYDYDADGVRVRKSSGMLYWPDTGGNVLAESDLSGNINDEYVFFNGQRIARIDRPSGVVHYYFSDHLGSSSVITDASGNVQEKYYYYPYGGIVTSTGSDGNHYKFTGKERDSESNLDYFGARHYSLVGRFMVPDPAQFDGASNMNDPQAWNGYAYALNNPLLFVDPTGLGHCIYPDQSVQQAAHDAIPQSNGNGDPNGKKFCVDHKGTWFDDDSDVTANVEGDPDRVEFHSDFFADRKKFYANIPLFMAAHNCQAPFLCNQTGPVAGVRAVHSKPKKPQKVTAGCMAARLSVNFLGPSTGWITVGLNAFALLAKPVAGAALPGPGWLYTATAVGYDAGMAGKSYVECRYGQGNAVVESPADDQPEEAEP